MKKAYNQAWVRNRAVREQANRWHRQGLLTDAQRTAIDEAYPVPFRTTNGYLDIGLFLFTTIAVLAVYLLVMPSVWLNPASGRIGGLMNIAFGFGVGALGQLIIRRQFLYRNGTDNALAALTLGFMVFGLNQLLPIGWTFAAHAACTLPLLAVGVWFYGDTLLAFVTLMTAFGLVLDSLLRLPINPNLLPVGLLLVSGGLYGLLGWVRQRIQNLSYYDDALTLGLWVTLSAALLSVNVYIVNWVVTEQTQTGSNVSIRQPVRGWWFWWIPTFLLPILYLWQGTTHRNRILLVLGFMGLFGAFAAVHHYFPLTDLNTALTVAGLVLAGLAVLGIRYLRKPQHGFSDDPDDDSPARRIAQSEALIAIQAASGTTAPKGIRFGGGQFGGGGSDGKY